MKKNNFASILSDIDSDLQRRFSSKLPQWYAAGCSIPSTLALEQCSSEVTAAYKAALVSGTLCDLTGGMGVDSFAFSKVCTKVYYTERDPQIAGTAEENFRKLGASNIECRCAETGPDTDIPECEWIYLDPARRSGTGKKVFLLEDCSPDVTRLMPELWRRCSNIMIKLSPMADISMVASRLGEGLKEVHVVGFRSEVKELLCILEKGFAGEYSIIAAEADGGCRFSFLPSEEREKKLETAVAEAGGILFEPAPILLKAGAFKSIGLPQLSRSTHLYIGETELPGKRFRIIEVLPFDKESFRYAGSRYPRAEVSAKNVPMTSEELRRRLKVTSGGSIHIFGVGTEDSRQLIISEAF